MNRRKHKENLRRGARARSDDMREAVLELRRAAWACKVALNRLQRAEERAAEFGIKIDNSAFTDEGEGTAGR